MKNTDIHALHEHADTICATEELVLVERVVRIVSSIYGAKSDYIYLATELEPAIPFDVFGVVLLQHDRCAMRITICQRDHSEQDNAGKESGSQHRDGKSQWSVKHHLHPLVGSMLEHVLKAPVLKVKSYPDGLDGLPETSGDALNSYYHLRATCIVPLLVDEHVLGTLEFGSIIPDVYANSQLQRLISAVARVLATAIERTQLDGNAQIQDRQRQALKDVSTALTSKMDRSIILEHIVVGITKALHSASAIVTLNHGEEQLQLEAQVGFAPALLTHVIRNEPLFTAQSIIGASLRSRQPHISSDIGEDTRFPASHLFAAELAMRSIVSYPLVTGTTVYGSLLLCSPDAGGFTPLKIDILALFAGQATIAIHNEMLLESTRQRLRFQEAIEQLEQIRSWEPNEEKWDRQSDEAEERGKQHVDDLALLARVREETQRTFGISFTSLLHFISDNLLTKKERVLQSLLLSYQEAMKGAKLEPLYMQQGQLRVNALQMCDITTQVRDEENKAAFLSSVSHDLRTPLTAIKAAVTGLLQTGIPWDEEMRREMLEDIDSETDHLTVMVNALVEMSRIEMGALILEKEWCDIVEIVYSTISSAKRVLGNRIVHVTSQPSMPLVYADHVQLGRVFYNLLENASRRSSEDAEIVLVLDTVFIASDVKMLRVQVTDHGPAIPEYEREHVFKSFYGFHSYENGLGLAICKGIIEAHQGHIWVDTTADEASCFIFTLPTHSLSVANETNVTR